MPATRKPRTSTPGSGPAAKGTQKTLAFSNSKISKPSQSSSDKKSFTPPPTAILSKAIESLPPPPAPVAVLAPPKPQVQPTEYELRAQKVSDAQIKKYWKAREAERISARVHQEGLSVEEKVLRFFDMSSQFGPCVGTPRKNRWIRANRLNLNPPIEVLAVLLKEEEKGSAKLEKAYLDELMSSKQVD